MPEDQGPIRRWAERIAEFDKRLAPLAQRPVAVNDPGWVARLTAKDPLEEAGIRSEVEILMLEVVEYYGQASAEQRVSLRRLFDKNRAFAWAAALPERPATAATIRHSLLHFSIADLGRDSRDAILWLSDICKYARTSGIETKGLLEDVAALSNDHNKHGLGSARDLLLQAL